MSGEGNCETMKKIVNEMVKSKKERKLMDSFFDKMSERDRIRNNKTGEELPTSTLEERKCISKVVTDIYEKQKKENEKQIKKSFKKIEKTIRKVYDCNDLYLTEVSWINHYVQ